MKYMGSKRFMLNNGLGKLITNQLPEAKRFVDLFSGSGSVINYVAGKGFGKKIIASDLQKYAVVLAKAVIGRTKAADPALLEKDWIAECEKAVKGSSLYKRALATEARYPKNLKKRVKACRKLCNKKSKVGPIWNAYGGHYFSPSQAITFDHLLRGAPKSGKYKDLCLAAIIIAAARCAASPGHTAQPFQPTRTAGKFIEASWKLDPIKSAKTALKELCPLFAKVKGAARVSDAKRLAKTLRKGDLVFVDPPYSGVQYSRFYHVLETIAKGKCGKVEGIGRYPSISERPKSKFSNVGQSVKALEELMSVLAKKRTTVILTFPRGRCSNGLSGSSITSIAKKWFHVKRKLVHGHFSTLGGNIGVLDKKFSKVTGYKSSRTARVKSEELLLLLIPKALRKR